MPYDERPYVGDIGTVFYINVLRPDGTPFDTVLDTMTLRTVHIRRPVSPAWLVITEVPTEVANDVVQLKLMSGTLLGDTLTGLGEFALQELDVGTWLAQVQLGNASSGPRRSTPFEWFTLYRNLK